MPLVPYTFPIIGSTKEYQADPQAFIEKWTAKLGPVFRVHLFGRVSVEKAGKSARYLGTGNQA